MGFIDVGVTIKSDKCTTKHETKGYFNNSQLLIDAKQINQMFWLVHLTTNANFTSTKLGSGFMLRPMSTVWILKELSRTMYMGYGVGQTPYYRNKLVFSINGVTLL